MSGQYRTNILALEFSSRVRSVAVGSAAAQLSEVREEQGKRSSMSLINQALQEAHLSPADINLIAVGLGPGSYTGIRSAIAIAQGWQLALKTTTVGVSSALVIAASANSAGVNGAWQIVIDAQRGDVYLAACRLEDDFKETASLTIVPAGSVTGPSLGPDASRLIPGAADIFPSAKELARLALEQPPLPSSDLKPLYLREATFVKAPPVRNY